MEKLNPIIEMTKDINDPVPLVELKQHLVFFVPDPPGPKSARKVYDMYLRFCGDVFKIYQSTFPGEIKEWTQNARHLFEQQLLPNLRVKSEWGYGFSDGKPKNSWLFMFHGFRPFQQPDFASFYRFEFDWQVDTKLVLAIAEQFMSEFPFLSGYGGYFLNGRPGTKYGALSYDRIFALSRRYWGCEVTDTERTAEQMKKGYKSVNWLTIIGDPFRSKFREEIEIAKSVAYGFIESNFGVLLQAAQTPLLGDRNRQEDMEGYNKIANALLPMQVSSHGPFGGNVWTEENTMALLRRFTHPHDVTQ